MTPLTPWSRCCHSNVAITARLRAVGRFLAPDGVMFPEVARLYACPSSLAAFHCDQLQCWREPYGLDMTAVADAARASMQHAPQVRRAGAGPARRKARRGRLRVGNIDGMTLIQS